MHAKGEKGELVMAPKLNYLGGIPKIKKPGTVAVKVASDYIVVSAGIFKKVSIPYSAISDVSMKTDEQISEDVTIMRILTPGIFAFGAKKNTKVVTNNLVIEYECGGLKTSAIFSGDEVSKVGSNILERRMQYLKKYRVPAVTVSSSTDAAEEMGKYDNFFDSRPITQKEFDTKKKQLLGL